MENQESLFAEFETTINTPTKQALLSASKWAKVLAIVYLTIMGLALVAILVGSLFSFLGNNYTISSFQVIARDSVALIIIFVIIVGVLSTLFILQLLKFANRVQKAVEEENTELLEKSFENLRLYFVLLGIASVLSALGSLFKLIF